MDASPVSAGDSASIRAPIGIIGAITPFNFPLNLVAPQSGTGLAAGNSVVLKPATKTPLTSIKLAELLMEAGLPPELSISSSAAASRSAIGWLRMSDWP